MAIIGSTVPTLVDAHKASGEGIVLELLAQNNPILKDAIATQCNLKGIHRHSIRTGLPSAGWGKLYKGVQKSKTTLQQVDDTTGFLEARSEIDTRLLKLAPDPAKQRLVDSAPFLEAMNQEMATGLFYHDTDKTPEKFKGFAPRFSAYNSNIPDPTRPNAANQVINAGGTGGDNTSIWFVTWADHAASLLYPEGTKAGVEVMDKGEEPVKDDDGNTYYAKVTAFEWHMGAFVKDYRYMARIANIDVSEMMAGNVDLWKLLRQAYYRLYMTYGINAKGGRTVCYMNRQVMEILDEQSTDRGLTTGRANSVPLKSANLEGEEVTTYRNIPIRIADSLLSTEAPVPPVAL